MPALLNNKNRKFKEIIIWIQTFPTILKKSEIIKTNNSTVSKCTLPIVLPTLWEATSPLQG